MVYDVSKHGFEIVAAVIDDVTRHGLISAIGPTSRAGRRGLLALPAGFESALSTSIVNLVRPHLASDPIPVRAIFFNKSAGANWLVAWHQDVTIALRERVEVSGFGPWSVKDDIPHVQPPVEVLNQ